MCECSYVQHYVLLAHRFSFIFWLLVFIGLSKKNGNSQPISNSSKKERERSKVHTKSMFTERIASEVPTQHCKRVFSCLFFVVRWFSFLFFSFSHTLNIYKRNSKTRYTICISWLFAVFSPRFRALISFICCN